MLNEGLLKRIESSASREAFDGLNGAAVRPHGKIAAGINRLAVQQHGARAAFTAIAADFCSGEMQVVAQKLDECPAIFDFYATFSSIHCDAYRGSRNRFDGLHSRRGPGFDPWRGGNGG